MTEPIVLLRLEGPLQSWGIRSRWSRRDTGPEPTKSAIIGLLGCAVGILRPDWRSAKEPDRTLEDWDSSLRFGVRIDRPGSVETDYQTVQGRHWQANRKMKTASSVSGANPEKAEHEPPHTEVTWRDYLHDAAFLVALQGNADLLRKLEQHLNYPKWPLYLGRKACVPSRPVLDRLTHEYDTVEIALSTEPWAPPRTPKQCKPPTLEAWVEASDGDYERQDSMRLNQLRFYEFRRCKRIEICTSLLPGGSHEPEPSN
jgi:CRISPR system Cascade subunit CasD